MREGTKNTVDMFYTSVGQVTPTHMESVVSASTGTIMADDNGVWFEGFDSTIEMFQADGVNYANEQEDAYFDFRDPHPFINPVDGKVYCLFEGNAPGMRGDFVIGCKEQGHLPPGYEVGAGAGYGAAAIGIATIEMDDYLAGRFNKWKLLPALVTAVGVNDQTERPHVVFKDDGVYVFTISHHSTYSGGLQGPDGVYGFYSEKGLFGPYRPINSSGLVLGNPSSQPYSTYSHFVDTEGYIQSFIDTVPTSNDDPQNPATFRIGATLAPTVKIVMEHGSTFLTEVHGYGQIFAQKAWPVDNKPDSRSTALVTE